MLVIPVAIVLGLVAGAGFGGGAIDASRAGPLVAAGGLLFAPPLLMLVFRRKYPLWWSEWNRELLRFSNRVHVYLWLMDDRYPSTDEDGPVHLDFPAPDGAALSRWLPIVKPILAIPHFVIVFLLGIAAVICVIASWFAILITGRYPRALFEFVEGVLRWGNRVTAYALILVTDRYPPFSLRP